LKGIEVNKKRAVPIGVGMALGAGIGVAIGNIILGIVIGLAVGGVWAAMSGRTPPA
jgi:hypothetical protein